jgi:hypothetical protein
VLPRKYVPAAIIRNLRLQTQLQTLWKSEENLVDLHAAGMVQTPGFVHDPGICHSERSEESWFRYTTTAA